MPRRPRLRRTLKWTATIACGLFLTAFVGSRWFWVQGDLELGAHGIVACISNGSLVVVDWDARGWPSYLDWLTPQPSAGLHSEPKLDWWPEEMLLEVAPDEAVHWSAHIPLWLPLLAAFLPTLILWRLDRRRPLPNHCRNCNYNLTGNVSGRCPECGVPLVPSTRPPTG